MPLVLALLTAVQFLFEGYIISKVWDWYICSVSEQIPSINLIQGVGISLLYTVMNSHTQLAGLFDGLDTETTQERALIRGMGMVLIVYPFLLLWAWAFTLLM